MGFYSPLIGSIMQPRPGSPIIRKHMLLQNPIIDNDIIIFLRTDKVLQQTMCPLRGGGGDWMGQIGVGEADDNDDRMHA